MRICKDIRVYGRVQGVGFRYSARAKARELELDGQARNEPDGSVHITVAGSGRRIDEFIEWCRRGPDFAKVERIEAQDNPDPSGFKGFSIS